MAWSNRSVFASRYTRHPADSAQKWVVAKSQSAEYLRVRNPGTDRCVGTSGNGLSNGRAIAISVIFSAFLAVTYLGMIALGQLRLPWRPPAPFPEESEKSS